MIAVNCGYHICTVSSNGTGFTDLIEPYDRDQILAAYSPVFSPDGTMIAFRGYPGGGNQGAGAEYDLYVMKADGRGLMNFTGPQDAQNQDYAQWSPDGSMIAFNGDDGLYVIEADGSEQRKLADGANAAWSPDGSWIAFTLGRSHGADLWKIRPDASDLTKLTESPGWDELPVWSPDGSRIAFLREGAIYSVDPEGGGLAEIVPKDLHPFQPQWSPDGTRLAFEADNGHDYDIYVVGAEGSDLHAIASDPNLTENYPIWSPDGVLIAYGASDVLTGENAGSFDLYVKRVDQEGASRVTRGAGLGVEFDISWQVG